MTAIFPLPIWPWPISPERYDLIGQAIAQLNLPYQLQAVPASPGSPGRMLCFGEPAKHYSEHVVIHPDNVDKVDSIRNALNFLINAPAGTPGSMDEQTWLEAAMGVKLELLADLDEWQLQQEAEEAAIYAR